MAKKTAKPKTPAPVQSNLEVQARAVDRSQKTIKTWRAAMQAAESITHPNPWLLQNLYTDILLDEHLTTVLGKSRVAVTDSTLLFLVDGKPDEAIAELIATQFFTDLLEHIHDSEPFGFSLIRFDPTSTEHCEIVPRGHVKPTLGLVVRNSSDLTGYDYLDPAFQNHYLAVGRPGDHGLLLIAAMLVLYKRGDIADWATFNEIFGMPLRKGKYDPYQPSLKKYLEEMFDQSGSASWVVHPEGTEVEYVENSASGTGENFNAFAARMEAGLSKLFLGQTLTTEVGTKGNMSTAQVHLAVEEKLARSRRNRALKVLNGRVRQMLVAWGYPQAEKGLFSFADEEERLPKDKQLEIALKVNAIAPVSKKWLYENFNLPPAESDDDMTDDHRQPEEEPLEQEKGPKEKTGKAEGSPPRGKNSAPRRLENVLETLSRFFG